MSPTILAVIIGIAALIVGVLAGKFIFAKDTQKQIDEASRAGEDARRKVEQANVQAEQIIKDAQSKAETWKGKKELEAKERFLHLKSEHEKDVLIRTQKLSENENRIKQQNQSLVDKTAALQKQTAEIDTLRDKL